MRLPDHLAPYIGLIRVGLYGLIIGSVFIGGCQHGRKGLAEIKAKHAATLDGIAKAAAEQAEKARAVQESFKAARKEAESAYQKGVRDAYERGVATAAAISTGRQPVSWVWRDNCPKAPAGEGAGPDGGDSGVSADRAQGMGRILALAGVADANDALLRSRLAEAQKLLNACYEEPAIVP